MKLENILTKLFINNEFVNSVSNETFDTINPATEDILATVQRAKAEDVDVAVKAAKDAFHVWRDVSGCQRRDLLLKFSDLMEMNQQYLAEIESADNGKPVSIARDVDIQLAIKHVRYFAGWADKLPAGKVIQSENTSTVAMTLHEPIGVVGGIIPWNFPILMFIWKVGKCMHCKGGSMKILGQFLPFFAWFLTKRFGLSSFYDYSTPIGMWLYMRDQVI
jgi:NAD-dependent aldehyde dehydrogenases